MTKNKVSCTKAYKEFDESVSLGKNECFSSIVGVNGEVIRAVATAPEKTPTEKVKFSEL